MELLSTVNGSRRLATQAYACGSECHDQSHRYRGPGDFKLAMVFLNTELSAMRDKYNRIALMGSHARL